MGNGYIAFPVLRGAYKDLSIILEFRPDTLNGLVLFSAGHPYARSDFFSVSLVDGHVEFRYVFEMTHFWVNDDTSDHN